MLILFGLGGVIKRRICCCFCAIDPPLGGLSVSSTTPCCILLNHLGTDREEDESILHLIEFKVYFLFSHHPLSILVLLPILWRKMPRSHLERPWFLHHYCSLFGRKRKLLLNKLWKMWLVRWQSKHPMMWVANRQTDLQFTATGRTWYRLEIPLKFWAQKLIATTIGS